MVVAKRLTRTGVRRNLIKRQARALFADTLGKSAGREVAPCDVVLRLTRNSVALLRAPQYAELAGLFAALLREPVQGKPAPSVGSSAGSNPGTSAGSSAGSTGMVPP